MSLIDRKVNFSETAKKDLKQIADAAILAFDNSLEARRTGDMSIVQEVNRLEIEVDFLEDELREKHIERLVQGKCNPEGGIIFLDIISNLERVSDHATNLAEYVTKEM